MLKLLTTLITFFTSDDSLLYHIAILQASISPHHKRSENCLAKKMNECLSYLHVKLYCFLNIPLFYIPSCFRPCFSWSCHEYINCCWRVWMSPCLRNNSCKSFNVHPGADIAKRLCELNNKTRKMKPDDFITKKGSSYYGQVKVRSTVWT